MLLLHGKLSTAFIGLLPTELAELCEACSIPNELVYVPLNRESSKDPVYTALTVVAARFGATIDKNQRRFEDPDKKIRVWILRAPEWGRKHVTVRYFTESGRWDVNPNIRSIEEELQEAELTRADGYPRTSAETTADRLVRWAGAVPVDQDLLAVSRVGDEQKQKCKTLINVVAYPNQRWWSAVVELEKSGANLVKLIEEQVAIRVTDLETLNKHYEKARSIGYRAKQGYKADHDYLANTLLAWEKTPVLTEELIAKTIKTLAVARYNMNKLRVQKELK